MTDSTLEFVDVRLKFKGVIAIVDSSRERMEVGEDENVPCAEGSTSG